MRLPPFVVPPNNKTITPILVLFIILGLFASGCNMIVSKEETAKQTQLRETELDISVKQTLLFEQAVSQSIELTARAESTMVLPVQTAQTTIAPPATLPPSPPPSTPTESPIAQTIAPEPIDEAAFNEWIKSAKILLYEDMTARLDTFRYVKTTLDEMKLPVKDDGSAFGWLLNDLENGPKDGGQWDLLIIAAEDKDGAQADFFKMMQKAIAQGSSGILEVWYLNNTANSSAKGLLDECGIEYENNWTKIAPSNIALYPLSRDHPILNDPNRILSFTRSTDYWWDPTGTKTYDIGDLVKLRPGSEATLLLGTIDNINTAHGISTVCLDGRLIIQSFSSHVLDFKVMSPLWENYIINALRTRFVNLN